MNNENRFKEVSTESLEKAPVAAADLFAALDEAKQEAGESACALEHCV
ncbi:hypothetical protein K2X33_06650 [bacterium]|nr:hypothetical protein [bacterium]